MTWPRQRKKPRRPPPQPQLIAVDVDRTLVDQDGQLDVGLVDWLRVQQRLGWDLMLWSSRGEDPARQVAQRHQVAGMFSVILAKPGVILDDQGADWLRHVQVVRPEWIPRPPPAAPPDANP